MLGRLALLVCLACALTSSVAFAQADESAAPSSSALEEARQRYQEGAAAFKAGRYKDAIDLFMDARRIAPKPAFSYNIGLAYEHLGDAPNALKWYRDYLRQMPDAPDRGEVEPRIRDAENRLAQRGVQQVTVLSTPEGATVTLDDRPMGVTPWTGELSPGSHRLTLQLRGYEDASTKFDLLGDQAIDVTLELSLAANDAVGPAAAAEAPAPEATSELGDDAGTVPAEKEESAGVSAVTWVALGVGVVGLGASGVLEMMRRGAVSEAESAPTQLAGKDKLDEARSLETPARIALGVGAASLIVGSVLLYLDLSSEPADSQVAFGCSARACDVLVNGRF
jgi:tetratricopeptide (TPR) repeat protein